MVYAVTTYFEQELGFHSSPDNIPYSPFKALSKCYFLYKTCQVFLQPCKSCPQLPSFFYVLFFNVFIWDFLDPILSLLYACFDYFWLVIPICLFSDFWLFKFDSVSLAFCLVWTDSASIFTCASLGSSQIPSGRTNSSHNLLIAPPPSCVAG